MFVEPFIPFLLLALALFATPGPATLSIAASGAAFGFGKTVYYIFGLIVGMIIIFVMVALGLGLLFDQYPIVHTIFQWVSLLYMLYLAFKIATAPPLHSAKTKPLGPVQGVLLNLVNPKAYFAVIALVSQYTQPGEEYFRSFILLMIWSMGYAFCTNLGWAYGGTFIASKLSSDKVATKINIGFAVLLVVSIVWTMFL
ncbi:MAG: LysE family translocator [Cyclobacteriaceae bacterium]